LDKLKELRTAIDKERKRANPFFVDLRTKEERAKEQAEREEKLGDIREQRRKLNTMDRYHISDDRRLVAMQVRPLSAITSVHRTRDMYQYLVDEAQRLKREGNYPDGMKIYVSGNLRNAVEEYKAVVSNVADSAWVSALLVLLMLLIVFRRPIRLFALLVPLVVGLIWAISLAAIAIGYLNLITATLMVVLFGLGIDHGIHLLERYLRERTFGYGIHDSLVLTLGQTGKATLVSGLTTAGGFMVMVWADFKGFSHLGLIAGMAMLTIIAAYGLLLPPILILIERVPWLRRRMMTSDGGAGDPWFWPKLSDALSRVPNSLPVVVSIAVALGGAYAATLLSFNENFDVLMAPAPASKAALAKQRQVYTYGLRPAAVYVAPDDATAQAIAQELKRRKATDTDTPTLDRIITFQDVIPSDQAARLDTIHGIAAQISGNMIKKADDDEMRDFFKELRDAADLEAITWDDLPRPVQVIFTPLDGSKDRPVFVFSTINRRNGTEARMFSEDVRPIEVGGTSYVATGDTLILATMMDIVLRQGLLIFAMSLLTIGLLLWLQFRSLRHTFMALIPLSLGLGLMAILLAAFAVDVNFYNMAIFAAVVGMGIDSGIHLYNRWLDIGGADAPGAALDALGEVGAPVTASIATTAVGYLALALADHPGLHSIGILAFIGLSGCYIASVTLFPLILRLFERPSDPSSAVEPG
ncbi:MAG: MMPL family transporter, partial [Myxococcota bacterium]